MYWVSRDLTSSCGSESRERELTTAPRPRPKLLSLIVAALPVSQHMAVIALFLAVYYGMLEDSLSPSGVAWTCSVIGLVAYALWRIGWETKNKDEHPTGRESILS